MIFVAVGTQKFQLNRLLKAVDDLVEQGLLTGEVFAQTGHCDYVPRNYRHRDFLSREEFQTCLSRCELLITHSGVATIIAALKLCKPVVVVPRLAEFQEHVDDHQLQIARSFSRQNYVLLCESVEDLAQVAQQAQHHRFDRYVSHRQTVADTIREYLSTIG